MDTSQKFMTAVRKKFRYKVPQGLISTEDLFDLPLSSNKGQANLDSIAVDLHDQLNKSSVKSFVDTKTESNADLQIQFDVVLEVIEYKKKIADAAEKALATRNQNQRILELIKQKEDGALSEKSIEELKAMLNQAPQPVGS